MTSDLDECDTARFDKASDHALVHGK